MQVQTYLFFNGRCEEALAFYAKALGAQTTFLTRFREAPQPETVSAAWSDKVMHANFQIGQTQLMASDGNGDECEATTMQGCSLSIAADTQAEAQRIFNALADGGTVNMPLQATFWSPAFGMLADRFGVQWMIMVNEPPAA